MRRSALIEERASASIRVRRIFFRDIPVMPGSKEILPLLLSSYEVFITTAAMEYPTSFAAKYEWIKEHFPFFPDSHIVFCGDKSIIAADFLIDDNAHHFERFKGQGLLFSAPHNLFESRYPRLSTDCSSDAIGKRIAGSIQ